MKNLWLLAVLMMATASFAQAAHSVQITWTESDTTSGITYKTYRGSAACSASPTMTVLTSGITTLTSTDSTVTLGNSYCYYITATAPGLLESAPSNSVTANVNKAAPPVITITIAQ